MARVLQFWFEFASTYSYLSALRVEAVCQAAQVELCWSPFLLGPIFKAQGWNDSPFNLYPAKGRYMWRDLERLCEGYGLPFRKPTRFPRNGLMASRVACAGDGESWQPAFVKAVYTANFAEDREIGERAVVAELLGAVGADAEAVLECAESAETKARLRAQTERAEELGIFGAPSFTAGGELFWGNDRLGDAIAQLVIAAGK